MFKALNLASVALAVTLTAANAQDVNLVLHNDSLMEVTQDRTGLVHFTYLDPRPSLRAIGVGPGVQLVWGRWIAPKRFVGTARIFACGNGYSYRVSGELVGDGILYLQGPAPVITPWCSVSGFSWTSDNAHLAFVPYSLPSTPKNAPTAVATPASPQKLVPRGYTYADGTPVKIPGGSAFDQPKGGGTNATAGDAQIDEVHQHVINDNDEYCTQFPTDSGCVAKAEPPPSPPASSKATAAGAPYSVAKQALVCRDLDDVIDYTALKYKDEVSSNKFLANKVGHDCRWLNAGDSVEIMDSHYGGMFVMVRLIGDDNKYYGLGGPILGRVDADQLKRDLELDRRHQKINVYADTMVDALPTLMRDIAAMRRACSAISAPSNLDGCAHGLDIAAGSVRAIQNRMSSLTVPDCLQNFDAKFRLVLNLLGQGYSTTRNGFSAQNMTLVDTGMHDINVGYEAINEIGAANLVDPAACRAR